MTPEQQNQWHQWRAEGIGASDIAAAHTGRYGGAYRVVADKLGLDLGDAAINEDLADRGHRWEQPIADAVHAVTGLYVAGEQAQVEHPLHPRWRATLDGYLIPTPEASQSDVVGVLEIKTRNVFARSQRDYYVAQVNWQMMVTSTNRCLLAVATIDSELDPTTMGLTAEMITGIQFTWVYAQPELQAALVDTARDLERFIDAGELPEPDSPEALAIVKANNAEAGQTCPDCGGDGKHRGEGRRKKCGRCEGKGTANVDNPPDMDDMADIVANYHALKEAAAEAAEAAAVAEAKIRARIGDAIETHAGDWRVRCGLPIRKFTSDSETDFKDLYEGSHPELFKTVVDREAAKRAMPDEYDDLKRPTTDRRLTIKEMT